MPQSEISCYCSLRAQTVAELKFAVYHIYCCFLGLIKPAHTVLESCLVCVCALQSAFWYRWIDLSPLLVFRIVDQTCVLSVCQFKSSETTANLWYNTYDRDLTPFFFSRLRVIFFNCSAACLLQIKAENSAWILMIVWLTGAKRIPHVLVFSVCISRGVSRYTTSQTFSSAQLEA